MAPVVIDPNVKPGEYVAQTLFLEFIAMAEKKISAIAQEPIEKSLTKSFQRSENPEFDQLLNALCGVSEHCLPSVLRASFRWYDEQNKQQYLWMQNKLSTQNVKADPNRPNPKAIPEQQRPERDYLLEKRGLAVDFIFCLILIEVLKQLPLHPGHDNLTQHIIEISFKQFRYKDGGQLGLNASNVHIIADLFAEVLGVLAQSRFHIVKKRFIEELNSLRAKEGTPLAFQNIIALLMGMKFFRVKMVPIEEFETCMSFLHELATYFIDVKDREVKHALAGLFVEILLPVAASVKTEVNVPAVKNFVDLLYPHVLDHAAKKKHSLAFFPLLTCLLCISQRPFFLSNWHPFLHMCLSNLKHKDPKMSRVALESLYRLVWVYVMRIKCESNSNTQGRLQSICNSLFPKGGRGVVPRDAPLNIFVKIIHFIAQERLDFAFKEVIFDLLCVGRPVRTIYPERMNIGLRALLVIADSLQQRDGPPPMPRTISVLPSGNTMRVKRTYLTKPLTNDTARAIGIDSYYGPCRRAFDGILRTLDMQVGRPLLSTVVQVSGKEAEDLLGGERKAKLDLFRTCIAAVPRVLPETMSHPDIIDMLARLTVHMDEELRALAWQTLQNLVVECVEWREDIFHGLMQFIIKEIPDSYTQLLENSLKLILQLLCCWRNVLPMSSYSASRRDSSAILLNDASNASRSTPPQVRVAPVLRPDGKALVLHCLEGLALVMVCQSCFTTRKLAIAVLKEVKQMLPLLCHDETYERPVIDVLDSACAYVLEKYIPHIPSSEKASWLPHFDFSSAAEKIPSIEGGQSSFVNVEEGNEYMQWDAWACALSGFTEPQYLLQQCPTAVAYAWQAVYSRMATVFTYVDPNNPQNDTRASLLRSSKSKATATVHGESLNYSNYLSLWQKYLVFACAVAPPPLSSASVLVRSVSPLTLHTSTEAGESRPSELRIPRVANVSASNLFRQVLPLLRCEMTDMRDIVVLGLGSISPTSFECLLDELSSFLREAAERRQENLRRKKRRDYLRLQLIRLLEIAVFRGTISNANLIDTETRLLKPVLLEFIENARLYLENDHDREQVLIQALHLHFAKLVATLVSSFPVEKRSQLLPNDTRKNLFYTFASWSGRLGLVLDRRYVQNRDNLSSDEYFAVSAMCAMLTCGPVFDSNAISDDKGYIYGWLDALIGSQNEKIIPLSEETLVLLLEYNSEVANLLDWVIDKCYTSSAKVADKCFRSLVSVFSAREYPCDYVSMFNLTLMYSGYPVIEIQCLAIELLQILDQRFFGDGSISYTNATEDNRPISDSESTNRVLESGESLDMVFSKSQITLSEQLAALRHEMTMPIFSEISQRLQTAKPARRSAMLRYLLPWMHNIELVDPNLESSDSTLTLSLSAKMNEANALARRVLKGEGWGSPQATEMILNNLLFLTVKYGNEHANLLEALWAGLIAYWPNNLRVVTRYLSVMVMLSSESLLPYAKRIIIYMARVNPERLLDEMMNELQTIDIFRCPLERSEMAPFYRWIRRNDEAASVPVETTRGVIHTRRHAPNDADIAPATADVIFDDEIDPGIDTSASMTSLITLKPEALNVGSSTSPIAEEDVENEVRVVTRKKHVDPIQLPMPAYGGYYCPLNDYLPNSDSPVVMLHRSYLGILLITDLVLADVDIEWTIHLPLMLHVAVLGLDHTRALVHDNCKQILINLILAHSSNCILNRDVTRVLVTRSLGSQLSLATRQSLDTTSTGSSSGDKFGSVSSRSSEAFSSMPDSSNTVSNCNVTNTVNFLQPRIRSCSQLLERDWVVNRFASAAEMAICITEFLAAKKGSPLWSFEDITSRNWRITSGEQLTNFVSHLSRLYADLLPKARTETRWAQTALHVALCCSNRHYAGRSFQVLRALRIPLTSRMLSDILSRLVETVCEQGEDMQGYVTEIMLTLDSSVVHMEVAEHSLAGIVKDSVGFQSILAMQQQRGGGTNNRQSPTHQRSTSYQVTSNNAFFGKRGGPVVGDRRSGNLEWRSLDGVDECANANLPRSKSAHALKTIGETQDEHMTALSQLLWIAVSLLESDYEHEFLLALRLLEKLIDLSPNERQDLIDRLDRMIKQISWTSFSGLLHLVLKGCTFATTYDAAVQLLTKMTPLLTLPAIDNAQQKGFPLAVIAMMPYLILHYEDPTKLCIASAENIAEACHVELERLNFQQGQLQKTEQHPLEHLGTVMRLYSKRTFSKECMQWLKCVVKYLSDTYPSAVPQLLVILTEILDRGSAVVNLAVLQLVYCVFHHVDLSSASPVAINSDCLKVVSRHIQGPHWREAVRILKLAVTRSSTLSSPCSVGDGALADSDAQRKELPGRVMEFNIDMAVLTSATTVPALTADSSPKRQLTPADGATWRKPWLNQLKVREHLVCLLNASGLRVGLPKSPSVIFSQSSHDIAGEPPSSVYSSSGELTIGNERASTPSLECNKTDVTSDTYAPVFKEFDFLDGEQDSMSESAESCFNWLSTMRPRSISSTDDDRMVKSASSENAVNYPESQAETQRFGSDSSDDEESTTSPVEEDSGEVLLSTDIDNLFNHQEQESQPDERAATPASISVCGSIGTPATEYNLTSHWPLFNLECSHHATGQIDEAWSSLVSQVSTDTAGNVVANATTVFTQLYREACSRMCSLVRDSCHFLCMSPSFREVSIYFGDALNVLMRLAECPFIFVTPAMLLGDGLLQRQKNFMLQLREHYDSFLERRECTIKCLNGVKSTLKLQLMGQKMEEQSTVEQEVELCRSLQKLFFQLLSMCETYTKMVEFLKTRAERGQMKNLTEDIATIHRELLCAVGEMTSGGEIQISHEIVGSPQYRLQYMLQQRDYKQALAQLRYMRNHHGRNEMYGCCDEVDVEFLLLMYCQLTTENRSACFALIGNDMTLSDNCNQLMEANINISTTVRTLIDHIRKSNANEDRVAEV